MRVGLEHRREIFGRMVYPLRYEPDFALVATHHHHILRATPVEKTIPK